MKHLPLNNWNYEPKTLEGALFFVQRLYELVFDYTSYIHKANRASIYQLCDECIELSERFDTEAYDSYEHDFALIAEEMRDRIKSDNVAKVLVGSKIDLYLACLETPKETKQIAVNLKLIKNKIHRNYYLGEIKKQIFDAVKEPNKKKNINNLCELFLLVLKESGYQQGTIIHLLNVHFFERANSRKIDSLDKFYEFFDYFDIKKSEYEVTFKGSQVFKEIEDSCLKFGIEVVDEIEARTNEKFEKRFIVKKGNCVFIRCKEIKAVDYLAARVSAEKRVRVIADLFVLFHHNKKPYISDEALVYHTKKADLIFTKKPKSAMSRINAPDKKDAAKILRDFLEQFSLNMESFEKFRRAVDLHSFALEVDDVENQILDLWICLETLLTKSARKTKIKQVIDGMIPIIRTNYIEYLVAELLEDLDSWNAVEVESAIVKLPEECKGNRFVAISALISLVEFKDIVVELFAKMDEAPLLRFKMMSLIENLQSSKDIIAFVNKFEKRATYDIRRLYRTRNTIVHIGKQADNGDTLVDSAHTFIDLILDSIIALNKVRLIKDIDQLLQESHLADKKHSEYLKEHIDKPLTRTNYIHILFGPDAEY